MKSRDGGETSGLLLKNWLMRVRGRSNGQADGQGLIDTWYEVMDAETFAIRYPVNGKLTESEVELYLNTHYDWVKNTGITKTPTTFMNGYELPAAYRVKDLFALVPGLVDSFTGLQMNEKDNATANVTRISEK
ncbi:hypothetical protein IQ255_30655 [Pleurocapsales cyanobacterium LEGE 10410]|nr:hypothetical protein [Pleurocapsales cyanobacterium LEGE 10410]